MDLGALAESVIDDLALEDYHLRVYGEKAVIRYTPKNELELDPALQYLLLEIIADQEFVPYYTIWFFDQDTYPVFTDCLGPYRDFLHPSAGYMKHFKEFPWRNNYPLVRLPRIQNKDNFLRVIAKILLHPAGLCQSAIEIARLKGYCVEEIKSMHLRLQANSEAAKRLL